VSTRFETAGVTVMSHGAVGLHYRRP